MLTRPDYHATRYVKIVPVKLVVPCNACGAFNKLDLAVTLEHGIEPDVSLPACRTCGTPMEPMRDDVVDTALCLVMNGVV